MTMYSIIAPNIYFFPTSLAAFPESFSWNDICIPKVDYYSFTAVHVCFLYCILQRWEK